MFEQEINETIQRITRDVLQERTVIPLAEILEESRIPERFKAFFEIEARWWIYTESVARSRDRRFDFSHPELDSLLSYLEQIQVRHARFERDDFIAVLDSAVKLTYNYLCRPQTTLKWYVFRGEPTKSIGETLLRMEAFVDYPYFRTVFSEWVDRKKKERPTFDSISSKEFERIIRRIDDQILLSCTIDDLLGIMDPLFDFVGKGEAQSIPVEAMIVFFDDKNIRKLVDFLERERGTRTHVTQNSFVLLMEDLLNSSDDEPDTDFSSVYQDDALDDVVRRHLESGLGEGEEQATGVVMSDASESLDDTLSASIPAAEPSEAEAYSEGTEEDERDREEEALPPTQSDYVSANVLQERPEEILPVELNGAEEPGEEESEEEEEKIGWGEEDEDEYEKDGFYLGEEEPVKVGETKEVYPVDHRGESAADEKGREEDAVPVSEIESGSFFVGSYNDEDPILDILIDPEEDERMLPESREEKELDYAQSSTIEEPVYSPLADESVETPSEVDAEEPIASADESAGDEEEEEGNDEVEERRLPEVEEEEEVEDGKEVEDEEIASAEDPEREEKPSVIPWDVRSEAGEEEEESEESEERVEASENVAKDESDEEEGEANSTEAEFKLVEESELPEEGRPVEESEEEREGGEKGKSGPEDVRSYIDAMLERKVVKKIFNRNRENYEATLDRLNGAETWREASRILDELFIRYDVDPYSRIAIRFTDSVYGRYLSPVYGS